MAKSDLGKYMTPSARSFLRAQQPRVNIPQRRASFDTSLFKGKTAAAGAPLESRLIEAPIQETGPEAMTVTDGEASTKPQMITETQQPIAGSRIDPRFLIQGNGPRIDLSGLFSEKPNPNYDPSKAIGGENVPYKPVGLFRSILGDPSNRKNLEAQQAQGAEWREARKEAEKEERLLNRIRESDKPHALRFERQLASDEERHKQDRETRAAEREQDRLDRLARETEERQRWRQERLDRVTQLQEENALRSKPRFGAISTGKGGAIMFNESEGMPVGTYSPGELGEIVDPVTGKKSYGIVGGGWNPYTPPVTVPKDLPDSPQVDRGSGLVPGAGTGTTGSTVPLGPENQNTAVLPRFGRAVGETLGGVMTSATDPMRYAGTELYKQLISSRAQQDPEVLKRLKKREEESSIWDIQ